MNLSEIVKEDVLMVMEATGYYPYCLAQYLNNQECFSICCKSIVRKAIYPDETLQGKNRLE